MEQKKTITAVPFSQHGRGWIMWYRDWGQVRLDRVDEIAISDIQNDCDWTSGGFRASNMHSSGINFSLHWRYNGRDSVSNHQPHDCLLNRLFRCRSKKSSQLRVTGLCVGKSPGTGEFPVQMASNAENISIWWRHHVAGTKTTVGSEEDDRGQFRAEKKAIIQLTVWFFSPLVCTTTGLATRWRVQITALAYFRQLQFFYQDYVRCFTWMCFML